MSYLPNIRERTTKTPYTPRGEETENAYWQGYLDDTGTRTWQDYDFAIEDMLTFFDNLDIYLDDLNNAVNPDDFDEENEDYVDTAKVAERKDLDEYSDEELRNLSPYTRFAIMFRTALMEWLESERNEFGISLQERIPDEESERLRNEVNAGKRTTVFTEEG